MDVKGGITTTTTYLGNIERIQKSNSSDIEWRRSVGGAIYTIKTNSNNQLLVNSTNSAFIFNDHLGSVDVITDANGKVTHSLSFDPWGARRDAQSWADLTDAQKTALISNLKIGDGSVFTQPITNSGFTGHEMVDDMGIIHMNGRIYDAKLGRFLQADPFIQAAANTQSYNRYSYLLNNPLNATDPSGFFRLRQWVGVIVAAIATYYCMSIECGQAAYAWIGAASGAASAAANGGNILIGAFMGFMTGGMGAGLGGTWSGFFVRGFMGGMSSVIAGGKFGNGFVSAGISSLVQPTGDFAVDVASQAIVGGTVSAATGGKFANGAQSSAMSFILMSGVKRLSEGGEVETEGLSEKHSNIAGDYDDQAPAELIALRKKYPELVRQEELIWLDSQATGIGHLGYGDPNETGFMKYFGARTHEEALVVYQNINDGSLMYDRSYRPMLSPKTGDYSTINMPQILPVPDGYKLIIVEHTHPFGFNVGLQSGGYLKGPSGADFTHAQNHPGVIYVVQQGWPAGGMENLYYDSKGKKK